jgi:hypothetical protein
MQNQGSQQFDYNTFKSAYDADPRVAEIVKRFNNDYVEFANTEDEPDLNKPDQSKKTVSKMAARATKLGK